MNLLFAYCCRPERGEQSIPDLRYQVFSAFDEGEFDHGDGTDAELTYTKPLIKRIIHHLG